MISSVISLVNFSLLTALLSALLATLIVVLIVLIGFYKMRVSAERNRIKNYVYKREVWTKSVDCDSTTKNRRHKKNKKSKKK